MGWHGAISLNKWEPADTILYVGSERDLRLAGLWRRNKIDIQFVFDTNVIISIIDCYSYCYSSDVKPF